MLKTYWDSMARRAGSAVKIMFYESAEFYRNLIGQVKDYAIFTTDPRGVITTWNEGCKNALGYDRDDFIGQDVKILFTPEAVASGAADKEMEIAAEKGSANDDRWMMRNGGERFWASGITTAARDEAGNLIGFTKVLRDLTERKQSEEERERLMARESEARAEAQEANRQKDEFLATVSHELRSPLNAILGWTRLLRDPQVRENQLERALEIVERNAQAQARLIENLLDVSRIVSGKLSVQMRPVTLNSTAQGVVADMRPAAEAKGIELRLTEDEEIKLIGDADRLQQVVWNLLSNAIKFTPEGGRIEVELKRIGERAELRVSDTGRGVSPEILPRVFDQFRHGASTDGRARAGLCLGLTIVRYIVEAHGGSVVAESPGVGQGATFICSLPLAGE